MPQITDGEYLARPLIEGIVYTIEDDFVHITSPHTLFVQNKRILAFDKEEILSLYQNVLQKAKSEGAKISYTRHFKKTVIEKWSEYEKSCEAAGELFDCILEQAKTVQKRGIHSGTTDDVELNELTKLCHEYGEFFWRSNVISTISDIYGSLKELEGNLKRASRYSEYRIYL